MAVIRNSDGTVTTIFSNGKYKTQSADGRTLVDSGDSYRGSTGATSSGSKGSSSSKSSGSSSGGGGGSSSRYSNIADSPYINIVNGEIVRNAAVNSEAASKTVYTPEDIETYGNRQIAYTAQDPKTGELRTIFSNYTRWDDAAKANGMDGWNLKSSLTYGISGSKGRGTTYGEQGYVSNLPAGGGW